MRYLKPVKIPKRTKEYTGRLSGVQQQLVAIARSLYMKPHHGQHCVAHEIGFAHQLVNRVIFI